MPWRACEPGCDGPWRGWCSHVLWVRVGGRTSALGDSLTVSLNGSVPLLFAQVKGGLLSIHMPVHMLTPALFVTVQTCEQLTRPPAGEEVSPSLTLTTDGSWAAGQSREEPRTNRSK